MSAAKTRRTKSRALSQREISEAFEAHWKRNGKRRPRSGATTPATSATHRRRGPSKRSTTDG